MRSAEIQFKEATDGAEAVELFRAGSFKLVFMDMFMPKKNGIEATEEIRAYEKEHLLSPVPIIGLSPIVNNPIKQLH